MKHLLLFILLLPFFSSCQKEDAPEVLKVNRELNIQGIYNGKSLYKDEILISSATPVTVTSEVSNAKNEVLKTGTYNYTYNNYSIDKVNSYKIIIKNDNQTIEYIVTRD